MSNPAHMIPSVQQLRERTIEEHIAIVEDEIRQQPGVASIRWALFQWLCIARQWERAVRQLQVFGQLNAGEMKLVHACRDLVRAERWRERVLQGLEAPGFVLDGTPEWMLGLITALELTGRGQLGAADRVRERALDAAPLVSGRAGTAGFDWVSDSDSRLGPVCELIVAGSYRWLAFGDIAAWQIAPPVTLLDLIWARASVTLNDRTVMRGFMPSRYPSLGSDDADLLDLGHQTVWHEAGRTAIVATGRKTWTTSVGDIGLFEWPDCTFGSPRMHEAMSVTEVGSR